MSGSLALVDRIPIYIQGGLRAPHLIDGEPRPPSRNQGSAKCPGDIQPEVWET